ncbi:MAG: DNA/RNA non-specific endonuclease [Muribaculaceae bacterium]|nr:DNA/RNA non-specific endonuclease [Muribaculaceae bacterium]
MAKKKQSQPIYVLLLAVVALAVLYFSSRESAQSVELPEGNVPAASSLLSVKTAPGLKTHLVHYRGFDVNFNSKEHIPNWVAWELTADEVKGDLKRTDNFMADPNVKGSATPDDYRHSSWDRGHMAPAGDMKWNKTAMEESFYMTNMVPQDPDLNRGSWNKLEQKCRDWAAADSAIYIVCGPVPGDTPIAHIGLTGVTVPARFFKVILSPYAKPARGIGFIFNNGDNPGGMQQCAVSIDSVEALTGHDFFSALPDDIEADLESQCNFNQWSRVKPKSK